MDATTEYKENTEGEVLDPFQAMVDRLKPITLEKAVETTEYTEYTEFKGLVMIWMITH